MTDPLTGLYNRRGGEVMVTQKLGSGKPYIFLMLDIDRFKEVNDFYGHHEGDNVLKYVAEELKHCFRRDDVIIRLGGDEFVIFVHPCTSIPAIENKLAGISTVYQEKLIRSTRKANPPYLLEGFMQITEFRSWNYTKSGSDFIRGKTAV